MGHMQRGCNHLTAVFQFPPLLHHLFFKKKVLALSHSIWNLSSLTRDQIHAPLHWKPGVLNHWTAREILQFPHL